MSHYLILRVDHTDDGPVETIHRHYTGEVVGVTNEVAQLNARKFRVPKRPDLRDSSGELFHPPTEFRYEVVQ